MQPSRVELEALLRVLTVADVRFVIVGGAAAVLHGVPVTTLDLDIVPEQSNVNTERLQGVLRDHHAVVRDPAGRHLEPSLRASFVVFTMAAAT